MCRFCSNSTNCRMNKLKLDKPLRAKNKIGLKISLRFCGSKNSKRIKSDEEAELSP